MRCRVQNVSILPNGSTSTKDREVTTSGNRVRIGRGTDNDIVLKDLAVAFRHADIVVRDFDIVVESVSGSLVLFDDVAAGRGALAPDTVVGIGPYQIRMLPPERGFDLALAIQAGETAAATPPPSAPVRLEGGLLARRPLSWLLFAVVLAGFLILPVLTHIGYQNNPAPVLADGRKGPDVQPTVVAGFDHAWDTGELSDPHKFLQKRCEACHVRAFTPIRNEDCGACHGTVRHHFADANGSITTALRSAGLEPVRCVSCHSEHRGARGAVPRQQALCVRCHAGLTRFAADTELSNVSDFGGDEAHPEFKPTVIVDARSGTERRLELGTTPPPQESSGLRFNHRCHLGGENAYAPVGQEEVGWHCADKRGLIAARDYPDKISAVAPDDGGPLHVDVAGVLSATFRKDGNQLLAALECGSCHKPDAGGANMRPVDMEQHCSYCHSLRFDPDKPERTLPHGRPGDVRDVLVFHYFEEAQRPAALRADPSTKRRRPGAKAEAAPAPGPTPQAPTAAPNPQFAKALERVFADNNTSTCGKCHRTERQETEAGVEYDVLPVRVQGIWEPLARFSHAPHTNLPCAHCHEASESPVSSDVLLPPIANCRECHLGEAAAVAVPSTCTLCHVYHQEQKTCPIVPGASVVVTANGTVCPKADTTAATAVSN